MVEVDIPTALISCLDARLPDYLEELRQLCAIECPTASKAGVDEAGAWVRHWAERRGWEVSVHPDETVGDSLLITARGGAAGGPRVLLLAHLDTVYPVGVAAQRPMRIEDDVVLGPGTCDNKSGLLSALHAMAALEDLDLLRRVDTVSLLCGADEETDMRSSLVLIHQVLPRYDVAYVLEAGRENGDVVSARKTSAHLIVEVEGHEAHAGVEPHRGANAILALAQMIEAMQALNGMEPGVTVNVGVISGGTLCNVVPGYARADVDVRATRIEHMDPLRAAVERIVTSPHVPGTRGHLHGEWRNTPMVKTRAVAQLAALARSCAAELGFELHDAPTGGISYANAIAGAGKPVLDGLGPIGGRDHSPDEYILASSIVPRTALLALLVLRSAGAEYDEGALLPA